MSSWKLFWLRKYRRNRQDVSFSIREIREDKLSRNVVSLLRNVFPPTIRSPRKRIRRHVIRSDRLEAINIPQHRIKLAFRSSRLLIRKLQTRQIGKTPNIIPCYRHTQKGYTDALDMSS
jgi:hypothetical protein